MRWWISDQTEEVSTSLEKRLEYKKSYRTDQHYHGQVLITTPEHSELIYEAEIGTASLVNVGTLHSSHNPTPESRYVITVALFDFNGNRVVWDDALNRLKDYIK
jgi:hypothetical protein